MTDQNQVAAIGDNQAEDDLIIVTVPDTVEIDDNSPDMIAEVPKGLSFDNALQRFGTSQHNKMTYARYCSELAIVFFEEHGKLCQLQSFYNAMSKNYNRRQAFTNWLAKHAPVSMENDVFFKDKSENAKDFDLVGALSKPYWDFSPPAENIDFTGDDVIDVLTKKLATYRNTRHIAVDDLALDVLTAAEEAVNKLRRIRGKSALEVMTNDTSVPSATAKNGELVSGDVELSEEEMISEHLLKQEAEAATAVA